MQFEVSRQYIVRGEWKEQGRAIVEGRDDQQALQAYLDYFGFNTDSEEIQNSRLVVREVMKPRTYRWRQPLPTDEWILLS